VWIGMLAMLGCSRNPAPAPASLTGTSWQLVEFVGGDGRRLAPGANESYTIAFEENGRLSVRVDCNHGMGTWSSPEPSVLRFGPLGLTKMYCGAKPLNDRMPRDWEYVRTYTLHDGHLFLSLMADAGIYEFAPR
jgi:para-nitrobenzyl esterase